MQRRGPPRRGPPRPARRQPQPQPPPRRLCAAARVSGNGAGAARAAGRMGGGAAAVGGGRAAAAVSLSLSLSCLLVALPLRCAGGSGPLSGQGAARRGSRRLVRCPFSRETVQSGSQFAAAAAAVAQWRVARHGCCRRLPGAAAETRGADTPASVLRRLPGTSACGVVRGGVVPEPAARRRCGDAEVSRPWA